MSTYTIGSVSSGTLRSEDLIASFSDELEERIKVAAPHPGARDPNYDGLLNECSEWLDSDEDDRSDEDGSEIVDALIEALNDYAPPYFYFGAHPGDGADFGYWLSEDVAQSVKDDGGLVVGDLSEVPEYPDCAEVLLVNDHGNCTLFTVDGNQLKEVWSVV